MQHLYRMQHLYQTPTARTIATLISHRTAHTATCTVIHTSAARTIATLAAIVIILMAAFTSPFTEKAYACEYCDGNAGSAAIAIQNGASLGAQTDANQEASLVAQTAVDQEASLGAQTDTYISPQRIQQYLNSLVGQKTKYSNLCLAFVCDSWKRMGADYDWGCCANGYGDDHIISTSVDNIPIGADVFFTTSTVGPCEYCGNYRYGHIGIYVGDGYFIHVPSSGIVTKTPMSHSYWSTHFRGWGIHGNVTIHMHDWTTVTEATHGCDCGTVAAHTYRYNGLVKTCVNCGAVAVASEPGYYYGTGAVDVFVRAGASDGDGGLAGGTSGGTPSAATEPEPEPDVVGTFEPNTPFEVIGVSVVDGMYWGKVICAGQIGWVRMAALTANGTAGVHDYVDGTCTIDGSVQVGSTVGVYRTTAQTTLYDSYPYAASFKTVEAGTELTITKLGIGTPDNDWWGYTPDGYIVNMRTLTAAPVAEYFTGTQTTIADGVYTIESAGSSAAGTAAGGSAAAGTSAGTSAGTAGGTAFAIDLAARSSANGANIQLAAANGTSGQEFFFEQQSDGSYRITNIATGKALDVTAASLKNGANVVQYQINNGFNQLWYVELNADGTYSLRNKQSNLYLDITAGAFAQGTNIEQWAGNGGNAQKFNLKRITTADTPGVYRATCAKLAYADELGSQTTRAIAAGESVTIVKVEQLAESYWIGWTGYGYAIALDDLDFDGGFDASSVPTIQAGSYRIVSAFDPNFVLDTAGVTPKLGANISIWNNNGGTNQQFDIEVLADGTYRISSVAKTAEGATLVLDAAGVVPQRGSNVSTWTENGGANQAWTFVPVCQIDGQWYYLIESAANEKLVLDAAGSSPVRGANVSVWTKNGGTNQLWTFVAADSIVEPEVPTGVAITIACVADRTLVLDAAGETPACGSNICAWSANGGSNQQFIFEKTTDGYYIIHSAANPDLVLDAAGVSPTIGANVSVWTANGGMNQKWKLVAAGNYGTFTIASAVNPSFVLDAAGAMPKTGSNVSLWTSNGGANQIWSILS